MSIEQDYTRLLTALGMATMMAQSLEYSLVALFSFTYIAESGAQESKIREIIDSRFNQTLGKLIRDASKELNLTSEFTEELEAALKMRNWVTHHFFREYGAVGSSASLLNEATIALEKVWPMFEKTADKVHKLVIEKQLELGKTAEQISSDIEKNIQKYLDENGHA